jgi:hypothetical protein
MTLAILVLSLCFFRSAPAVQAPTTQPTETQTPPSDQGTQPQVPPANAQGSSGTQSSSETQPKHRSGNRKKTTTARTHTKKKAADAPPCVTTSDTNATGSHPQNASSDSPGQTSNAQSGTKPDSKDCPPPKIVIRQGGTKDPSIQLAGGNADQAGQKRDNINQLLGETDQNLKKAEVMQLTASQQDVVTQARQYVVQSRTAMANGDFERARTLAWKAQLLSQDLANPAK